MPLNIFLAVAVFACSLCLDYVQTFWLAAYTKRRAARAANLGAIEYGIGLLAYFAFFDHSHWLAVPELLGLWCGGYLSIRRLAASEAGTKVA